MAGKMAATQAKPVLWRIGEVAKLTSVTTRALRYWEELEFELPFVEQSVNDPWHRWIDTSLDSPADIVDWHTASPVPGFRYSLAPRSVIVLFAKLPN